MDADKTPDDADDADESDGELEFPYNFCDTCTFKTYHGPWDDDAAMLCWQCWKGKTGFQIPDDNIVYCSNCDANTPFGMDFSIKNYVCITCAIPLK